MFTLKIRKFFREAYGDNRIRRQGQKRNWSKDLLKYGRNWMLLGKERALAEQYAQEQAPVVFIVGIPRSGTTLLFQLMAKYLEIGYPSNAMAPYWMAPIWAAKRYQESKAKGKGFALDSDLGGTSGPESPHEFAWFWHYWVNYGGKDDLSRKELEAKDWRGFRREVLGLAGFFGKPFVFKSVNFVNYQIPWFHQLFDNVRFLWIDREPVFAAQSILKAREKRYGNEQLWWSVRPRDVDEWLDRKPAEQIAHQILDISAGIKAGLSQIPKERHFKTSYEALAEQPIETLKNIADFLGTGIRDESGIDQLSLEARNRRTVDEARFEALREALIRQCG